VWNFIKLFLLSYFVLTPLLVAIIAHWFFSSLSSSVGDVAGVGCGVGTFVLVVASAILRITSLFRD
jgi:hypothetical protein